MKLKHLVRPLEIKAVEDSGSFSGYGSVFNVMDSYRDVVLPGAFAKSIEDHKSKGTAPALLWQHRPDQPIGVWNSFDEDEHGLKMEGQLLLEVRQAKEAHALLKAKAVRGLSIGFTVPKGGEEFDEETREWKIKEIELWETSIVTFPANREATVSAVKASLENGDLPDLKDFERFLTRDAGFSRSQALAILNDGYKSLIMRDADDVVLAEIEKLIKGYQ